MFTWIDSYSVKINSIDKQHKQLLDIINSLFEANLLHKENEHISKLMLQLKEFAVSHFALEKEWMIKFNYPGRNEHIDAHDKLLEGVDMFLQKLKQNCENTSMDILVFLKNWVVRHLTKIDQDFYDYMKKFYPELLDNYGV